MVCGTVLRGWLSSEGVRLSTLGAGDAAAESLELPSFANLTWACIKREYRWREQGWISICIFYNTINCVEDVKAHTFEYVLTLYNKHTVKHEEVKGSSECENAVPDESRLQRPACCPVGRGWQRPATHTRDWGESPWTVSHLYAYSTSPPPNPERETDRQRERERESFRLTYEW